MNIPGRDLRTGSADPPLLAPRLAPGRRRRLPRSTARCPGPCRWTNAQVRRPARHGCPARGQARSPDPVAGRPRPSVADAAVRRDTRTTNPPGWAWLSPHLDARPPRSAPTSWSPIWSSHGASGDLAGAPCCRGHRDGPGARRTAQRGAPDSDSVTRRRRESRPAQGRGSRRLCAATPARSRGRLSPRGSRRDECRRGSSATLTPCPDPRLFRTLRGTGTPSWTMLCPHAPAHRVRRVFTGPAGFDLVEARWARCAAAPRPRAADDTRASRSPRCRRGRPSRVDATGRVAHGPYEESPRRSGDTRPTSGSRRRRARLGRRGAHPLRVARGVPHLRCDR